MNVYGTYEAGQMRYLVIAYAVCCSVAIALLILSLTISSKSSVVLFGAASIAPGTGFMIWGIRLFHERPSIGSGTVFFFQSIGVIAGPLLYGWVARSQEQI